MKSFDAIISSHKEPLRFRDQIPSKDLLAHLLQQAQTLPNAFYLHPTQYYIVTDEATKEAVARGCFKYPLVLSAPTIVIFTGDRFCAKSHETILDALLERNEITVEQAERARCAVQLHFDVAPIGLGWIGKVVGAPIMRLFTSMPRLPAVHKREFLVRQVMQAAMTFFWAAESQGLSAKIVDSYDEWRIKWAVNIPWHQIVVSIMLVGYAENQAKSSHVVPLDEVVHWDKT